MRIKFFSSFCDSITCKLKYEQLCETGKMVNYGDGKALFITTGEDYTHAIILNIAMPVLKNIPKENVLGLAFEPPEYLQLTAEFIRYAQKYIGKYFIGERHVKNGNLPELFHRNLPELFIEQYAYLWHTPPLTYIPVKNKVMSIMVSERNFAPGHKYRHTLVQHILSAGYPIDIYGRGTSAYERGPSTYERGPSSNERGPSSNERGPFDKDARLKGVFQEREPYENYQFHICIENFATNAYFSEKITNTLLCGATPIYWGCKNILAYFPANVITLSGDLATDMTLLRAILLQPEKYRARLNIAAIKQKINLLQNVVRMFS